MEPKKYSTGTKGRLKMHCDKCKEFIRANTSYSLATEFIASIDPDYDESVWQRFQTPADILPELQEWLGGEVEKPAEESGAKPMFSKRPDIKPASQIVQPAEKAALQRTRAWLASAAGQDQLAPLTPPDAAEAALRRFYRELTGGEPDANFSA
jgi:hypothetical protein